VNVPKNRIKFFAGESLNVPEHRKTGNLCLDDGIRWLSEQSQAVLDFGFGNGNALSFAAQLLL
jgi:hypothetical protein